MSRSCLPSVASTSPTKAFAVGCSNSDRRSLGACDGAVLDRAIAGISTKWSSGSRASTPSPRPLPGLGHQPRCLWQHRPTPQSLRRCYRRSCPSPRPRIPHTSVGSGRRPRPWPPIRRAALRKRARDPALHPVTIATFSSSLPMMVLFRLPVPVMPVERSKSGLSSAVLTRRCPFSSIFGPMAISATSSDDTTLSRPKSAARETTLGTLWTRRFTEQAARLAGNMMVSAASEFLTET